MHRLNREDFDFSYVDTFQYVRLHSRGKSVESKSEGKSGAGETPGVKEMQTISIHNGLLYNTNENKSDKSCVVELADKEKGRERKRVNIVHR